jgi:O-antigen/teichoic acid export membrane protein
MIIAIAIMPFIIKSLGDRLYGIWVLIAGIIGYYGILDFGLSTAVSRFVSRCIGEGKEDQDKQINTILSTSFVFFVIVGIVVLLISIGLALLAKFYVSNYEDQNIVRVVIILLGVNIALDFPFKPLYGLLSSYLRYDYMTYSSITRAIISNLLIYYFLLKGYGIITMAIINLLVSFIQKGMIYWFSRITYKKLVINPSKFDFNLIRPMLSYSYKSFISQVCDILRFKIDTLIIAIYLNVSLVTYYAIGQKLVNYFGSLILNILGVLVPVFSQQEGRGDYNAIRKRFIQATKIAVILSTFIGASIIYYGRTFIHVWMGEGFNDSYIIMVILTIPATFALMQNPGISLLYGLSKHHYYMYINIMEGVTNLFLSIFLVNIYGIFGVAYATAIEMIIFKLFVQPYYFCRAIELSITLYYYVIIVTFIKVITPLIIYFSIIYHYLEYTLIRIVLLGVLQVLIITPIIFYSGLDGSMRKEIIETLAFNKK